MTFFGIISGPRPPRFLFLIGSNPVWLLIAAGSREQQFYSPRFSGAHTSPPRLLALSHHSRRQPDPHCRRSPRLVPSFPGLRDRNRHDLQPPRSADSVPCVCCSDPNRWPPAPANGRRSDYFSAPVTGAFPKTAAELLRTGSSVPRRFHRNRPLILRIATPSQPSSASPFCRDDRRRSSSSTRRSQTPNHACSRAPGAAFAARSEVALGQLKNPVARPWKVMLAAEPLSGKEPRGDTFEPLFFCYYARTRPEPPGDHVVKSFFSQSRGCVGIGEIGSHTVSRPCS